MTILKHKGEISLVVFYLFSVINPNIEMDCIEPVWIRRKDQKETFTIAHYESTAESLAKYVMRGYRGRKVEG